AFELSRRISMLHSYKSAISVGIIILILTLSFFRAGAMRNEQQHLDAINRQVGMWLNTHASPEAAVAVKDIGYIGYYSKRRILDLAGLVSPECIPYRMRGDFMGPIL